VNVDVEGDGPSAPEATETGLGGDKPPVGEGYPHGEYPAPDNTFGYAGNQETPAEPEVDPEPS